MVEFYKKYNFYEPNLYSKVSKEYKGGFIMKKSVKYIIILLCLVIVALVSYIVVSKNFNTKDSKKQENEIEKNSTNIVTSNDKEPEFVETDFFGDWNNDEDTELTINSDGTFQADHYTASSTIFGDYTINGDTVEFVCKKNDETNNKKWSGKISKDSNGDYVLKVNLYDEENTLKKVENQNENTQNNTDDANNTSEDKTKVANEEIRKALKDKDWLEKNIYYRYNSEYNGGKKEMIVTFAKVHSIDGNPAYFIDVTERMVDSHSMYLITYKDGKVYLSKPVSGEYSVITADLNRNIVAIENDPTGITSVYKIENGEFVEFAKADLNYNDNTLYYYVNGENVSYGRYKSYIEGCVEITTELTNENIDKYVK